MAEKAERPSYDEDDRDDFGTTAATTFDDKHTHSQSIDQPVSKSEASPRRTFSIFTPKEKWIIIALAAMAALFR